MNEKLALQIYEQLARYLGAKISLKEFRDWFDATTWDQLRGPGSEEAAGLAGEIELRLAEFSSGHWSQTELREEFQPLLRVPTLRRNPL